MWGTPITLRKRDAMLLLADLLPAGFRRKIEDGRIQRKWSLRRLRPVWWASIGWLALLTGRLRFTIVQGGMYVIAGPMLREWLQRGYLSRTIDQRHGFLTSEEDTLLSIMTHLVRGRLIDINQVQPGFAELRLPQQITPDQVRELGHTVIHPIKNKEEDHARRQVMRHWAAESATDPSLSLL